MRLTLGEWREKRDWTQVELANRARVSIATVHGIEKGGHHPHVGIAEKLAEALGVGIDEIAWPPMHPTGYGERKPRKRKGESEASE